MEKIKLKKRVLLKESQGAGALLFSIENDQVYQFSGDVAQAVLLIKQYSKDQEGISLELLETELANKSDSFKKNNYKKECLLELVSELQNLKLLE